MARQAAIKTVQCYHCRRRIDVSAKAMSTSCPECYKPVVVQDVVVKGFQTVQKLQTCGRVIVKTRGRVVAGLIQAQQGIEVLGVLDGNAISAGPVVIGPKARWRGNCQAPSLEVKAGARIESGFFKIPYLEQEDFDPDDAAQAHGPEQRTARDGEDRIDQEPGGSA